MTTTIWQTGNSFNSKFTIFQETVVMGKAGQRVFADHNYAYALLPDIYRVETGSGIARNLTIITPSGSSNDTWILGHYLNDYGQTLSAVTLSTVSQLDIPLGSGVQGPSDMYTSYYPEFADQWTTQSGYLTRTPSDVASPDLPESPRFLIAFAGNSPEKVVVVLISGINLGTRYATNWSGPLSASSEITDLETVRII